MEIEVILSLFKKVATVDYPKKPKTAPPNFRGKPEFDSEKCVGCGACEAVCPSAAITITDEKDERKIRLWYGRCVFCGQCEEICPYDAIRLTDKFELTKTDAQSLVEEVVVPALRCKICGAPLSTHVQMKSILEKISTLSLTKEELERISTLCPKCKKKLAAKDIGKNLE
ncbi:MAG: 4Fe-4S dicluster domain-containing protein [Candidatus Methanofastidiosia archaeon]